MAFKNVFCLDLVLAKNNINKLGQKLSLLFFIRQLYLAANQIPKIQYDLTIDLHYKITEVSHQTKILYQNYMS